MKKVLLTLAFALIAIMTMCIVVAADAKEITIYYVKSHELTSTSTTYDKVAYENGMQTVKAGEEFTLPTAADDSYYGKEGYQLVWYTQNGRTYKPGETVSFTENTRLFRCMAKEAATFDEVNSALTSGGTFCAILTGDIEATKSFSLKGEKHNFVILNGYNINFNANATVFPGQRTGKHVIGEGTITATNPNGKVNEYCFFDAKSHSYNGTYNQLTVGVDVTVNAPNFDLMHDYEGSMYIQEYPKLRVYGNVNVYSLGKLSNQNQRSPIVEVYEDATVTITGPYIFNDCANKKYNNQSVNLRIYGGTFILPATATNIGFFTHDFFDENVHTGTINLVTKANKDNILIYGGSFNVRIPDAVLRVAGKNIVYNEATSMYEIKDAVCTNDNHSYVRAEYVEGFVRDCVNSGIYYNRCECGSYYVDIEFSGGHAYSIEVEQEATTSASGIKKGTCVACGDVSTYEYEYCAYDSKVTVTVNTPNGDKEAEVYISDLFAVTSDDSGNLSITDVIYCKGSIVKLTIPKNTTSIAIGNMPNLKSVTFEDGANVTFAKNSIFNCDNLETVALGKSTVVFAQGSGENTETGVFANCPNLAILDVSKANATFNKYSFASNKTIKHLLLGEFNTYVFKEDSFRHSSLKEVIIPDNTPTTLEKKCFAETESIEYVYIGANSISSKKIGDDNTHTSIFGGNSYLSKVVLMDIEYVAKWVFSTKKPGNLYQPLSDLRIYAHSQKFSFHGEAFNDRTGDYTIYLYTVNPSIKSLNNCNYVVFNGIGHNYLYTEVDSTCTVEGFKGYRTDCPCNNDYRGIAYTAYSNKADQSGDREPFNAKDEIVPKHKIGDQMVGVQFHNGFMSLGSKVYKCLNCDEIAGEEKEASFPALFAFTGYSTPENGDLAITVSYSINKEALATYESLMGALEFGVVGAVYEKLNGLAPLAQNEAPVVKAQVTGDYASFDFVIGGFKAEQMDLGLVMCAYVYDGTKYVYLQEVQTDNPTSVSINGILTQNA